MINSAANQDPISRMNPLSGFPPRLSDDELKTDKNKPATQKSQIDINNLPNLLTVREVAELLRVSPLTIKRWGKRGKLPAIRINSRGDRRYKKEAVLWLLGIDPQNNL